MRSMKKVILTVLAKDRPGILASVTTAIFEQDCNVEHVSQTILETEFAGIFVISIPEEVRENDLQAGFETRLAGEDFHIQVKPLCPVADSRNEKKSKPFVVTCFGPDRQGLVAELTRVIANHQANITNLKAVFQGGNDPSRNVMIYEVDIPEETDLPALSEALRERAEDLQLELNIQHRNIFDSISKL